MQHTYLRYECADAFGLTVSSASSKAPPSNSVLGFHGNTSKNSVLLTTAGSYIMGFHPRLNLPILKLGHREQLKDGVGTGRALNSDEVVCITVCQQKVATGWVDGSVRVFDLNEEDAITGNNMAHSLLEEKSNEEFFMREPLLLNGHAATPVRSICFDDSGTRLASGGSDGSVVLWDIVAETGLFRLLGHRGAITDIMFADLGSFRGLITTSLDGLVKLWDLDGQCCTQTIANHRGEVWGAACQKIVPDDKTEQDRWRLVTGSTDGQVRVWSVKPPMRASSDMQIVPPEEEQDEAMADHSASKGMSSDDVCCYMGSLLPPPNVSTSAEKVASVHYHPNGRYVGILHSNSKSVDVYLIRSEQESLRKKQRRLRRRREKKAKVPDENAPSGRKRGILDESSDEEENEESTPLAEHLDPESIKASDEFEYYATARAAHKIRGFAFVPFREKGSGIRIVCALSTNAIETLSLVKRKQEENQEKTVASETVSSLTMYGHGTGIRSIALSSDDELACTVSKNETKIWNVANRSCLQSLSPAASSSGKKKTACYGLCIVFLPGNTHVVLGTREGHLFVIDIASGDVVFTEENAHDGAIWSIDIRQPTPQQETIALVTGSADKTVKFWDIESQEDEDDDIVEGSSRPMVVHTRTLQMSDDVVAVKYSHSKDPTKRMVFASTLDSTIKVFFDDTLKFFLSLYGHKLPALAVDASDDDTILASSGADKAVKIWGLDFGDTHRTLYGHEDSVTDLRFVKRTHNFFTSSKDGTVRYWDGDRFEQILLLSGHCAEVNCLAISRTGAFVLSGGMDRQVRVWERTQDIVFLEEERERELEKMFDADGARAEETSTANIVRRKNDDADVDEEDTEQPQSEAAVRRSVLSVSAGDRIVECLERADQETQEIAAFRRTSEKKRMPNPLLLGLEPAEYVLWVLRSVKSAELEQSLLMLPLSHMERLIYYLIVLLRSGRGVELCSRVAVFMVKIHQNQLVATRSLAIPIRELRRLLHKRLSEVRDTVGFNLAALRIIAKVTQERNSSFLPNEDTQTSAIWAGLGLGSDVAAALEQKGNRRQNR